MSTISSIKVIENDHDIFRGKNYINKFCEFLSEHEMKIIRFQKKKKQSYYHAKSSNHKEMKKPTIFVKKN